LLQGLLDRVGSVPNPVHAHWPSDVLDLLLPQIVKNKGKPIANVSAVPAGVMEDRGFESISLQRRVT
jgi:hypothetical protein